MIFLFNCAIINNQKYINSTFGTERTELNMPVIYYACYTPVSESIPDIAAQEHTIGRRLLIRGLKDLHGISLPDGERDSILQTDKNGKPFLPGRPDICFNISHCSGLAVCAFDSLPVGVDAELPGYFADILINRALSETEKGFLQQTGVTLPLRQEWFYRLWTLKEAYVKKSGQGVDTDLTRFSFSFDESGGQLHVHCSDPLVSCFQEKLPSGQILSLCYTDTGLPVSLVRQIF